MRIRELSGNFREGITNLFFDYANFAPSDPAVRSLLMRPIGFSTGALAKGDFRRGVELQRSVSSIRAIELSALREHELIPLAKAAHSLDLSTFDYVSFHAPSKLREMAEITVIDRFLSLPPAWYVIAHPEILTSSRWRELGPRLCIENMDHRKTTGRTTTEMAKLFEDFPDAGFCLDLGHARQIDPTMNVAVMMLRMFGDRLRQLHVSEVGAQGEHLPLSRLAQFAFARVTPLVPEDCPIIIESVIPEESIHAELEVVTSVFERARAAELREFAFS